MSLKHYVNVDVAIKGSIPWPLCFISPVQKLCDDDVLCTSPTCIHSPPLPSNHDLHPLSVVHLKRLSIVRRVTKRKLLVSY